MITEKKKKCTKCGEVKPLEEYHKNGSGRRGECKPCGVVAKREYFVTRRDKIAAAQQEYYVKNRERIAAGKREYQSKNRERIAARDREYRAKNREKIAAYVREYNTKNREKRAAYNREYSTKNREKIATGKRAYQANNREKIAAMQLTYVNTRLNSDPEFRTTYLLRRRLHLALRGKGNKSAPTEQLLGCTFAEAKAYIERQFKEGMGWDKPKSFQIDHIIPCSYFDLTDPAHQRMCFCYLNLQPLTPQENQRKGGSLPPNHEAHLAKLQAFVNGRATL